MLWIYIAVLEIEISRTLYLMYGHGGHLEKWHFFIVGTLSESDTQSNIFFLYKIPLNKINYWSHNHIWVSRWRFGINIFGTQMTVILDLANKSLTNVAEMYFIGFDDPENIILDTKSIFLADLEIKISYKLDLMYGHGGHFEKCHFYNVWTLFEMVTRSNIFADIKIYQIRSRNLICLIWQRKIIFVKWPKDYWSQLFYGKIMRWTYILFYAFSTSISIVG